ncbi:MAG: SRPBCC family protein [archaeon]
MKTKNIQQVVSIRASPHEVFEALMDSRKHSSFTSGKAKISRRKGGKFSVFDGWVEGKNIEVVPDKRIVQYWRGSDWPKGHYSKVTFSFRRMKNALTRLTFTQVGVPESEYKDISKGWKEFYWKPMKSMLDRR